MNLSSDCFTKNILIANFDYLSKNGKRNWVSVVLSGKMHYLSIRQGLTLLQMENQSTESTDGDGCIKAFK